MMTQEEFMEVQVLRSAGWTINRSVRADGASAERRAALDRMVEIADEADMYERTATPKRTR